MHYDSRAFSMNGRTTIARKNGDTSLGNTRGLSTKDIQQAWLLYCRTKPTDDPPTLKPTTPSPAGKIDCPILLARGHDRDPFGQHQESWPLTRLNWARWPKGSRPRGSRIWFFFHVKNALNFESVCFEDLGRIWKLFLKNIKEQNAMKKRKKEGLNDTFFVSFARKDTARDVCFSVFAWQLIRFDPWFDWTETCIDPGRFKYRVTSMLQPKLDKESQCKVKIMHIPHQLQF